MLHTRKFNGREYTIQNEGYSNSRGWGHISKLYMNGMYMGQRKVKYINRTWESYRFRSCMQILIHGMLEDRIDMHLADYKEQNGIKRLTKKRREEAMQFADDRIDDLTNLYKSI
jgi:hypothetical protein|tara:strand:+ start:1435 stop:1776 length:342 start_codon:yes stop_codon:yes gene_type:complete